jgi:hypothetical protein
MSLTDLLLMDNRSRLDLLKNCNFSYENVELGPIWTNL